MNDSTKKILLALGIIAAVYLFFRYILPIILKLLGIVIGAAFHIILWVAIGFVIVVGIGYLLKVIKNR